MSMPHSKSHASDDSEQQRIVDADPNPDTERAAQLDSEDEEDAEFGKAEAEFAVKERIHGKHLIHEGKVQEGLAYVHDAKDRLQDANRIYDRVTIGDAEVDQMLSAKRQELALVVRGMSDQNLFTLRDAVSGVRSYVEDLGVFDLRKLSLASQLDESLVIQKRLTVIATGQNIEITLNSPDVARRDPVALVRDLITFTTVAMELATHLPQLMSLMNEFGKLLLQFHL